MEKEDVDPHIRDIMTGFGVPIVGKAGPNGSWLFDENHRVIPREYDDLLPEIKQYCLDYWTYRTEGQLHKIKPQHLNAVVNTMKIYQIHDFSEDILKYYREVKRNARRLHK